MILFLYLFFILVVLVFLAGLFFGIIFFAPWLPTKKKDFHRIAKLANLKSGQSFTELGSGSGGLILYLAKKYPDVEFIGVELVWPLWLVSVIRVKFLKLKNIKIKYGNLFNFSVSKTDVVFMFGFNKKAMHKLSNKFKKELKNDAKIISYTFKIPEMYLVEKNKPTDKDLPIFVYTNPTN